MPRKPSLSVPRPSRYDAVLLIIPAGFLVSLLLWTVVGLSVHASVISGASIGLLALVDGLFLHPPLDQSLPEQSIPDETPVKSEPAADDFAASD